MVFVDTFVLGAREFSKKTRPLRESAARVVLRRANYLEQARTLAEFLAENRSGRNYRVPPEGQPRRVLRLHAASREHPKPRREQLARRRDAADQCAAGADRVRNREQAAAPRLVSRPVGLSARNVVVFISVTQSRTYEKEW